MAMAMAMRSIPSLLALATLLSAAVASASPLGGRPLPVDARPTLADRLFPETRIEGEGWRGLLPIYLMNNEPDVRRPMVRAKIRETATR